MMKNVTKRVLGLIFSSASFENGEKLLCICSFKQSTKTYGTTTETAAYDLMISKDTYIYISAEMDLKLI